VLIAAIISAIASIVITAALAFEHRTGPARCPSGMTAAGPRCCGEGQTLLAGRCVGVPRHCAVTQAKTTAGCVLPPARIAFAGGRAPFEPADWTGATGTGKKAAGSNVAPFELDAGEVTVARWEACRTARVCDALGGADAPGEPVRSVTPAQAEAFCKYAGGHLPTGAQWTFAAMGKEGRRFPWGNTGLVCRRAAYGIVNGPCADAASGPEPVGSRPDGATPDGVLDLAGNVAEWTREPQQYVARGGSYRSHSASELKTYSAEVSAVRPDIGFRCAYPSRR
jgi:formylglycine-generating enzyme required for sulfatase activity